MIAYRITIGTPCITYIGLYVYMCVCVCVHPYMRGASAELWMGREGCALTGTIAAVRWVPSTPLNVCTERRKAKEEGETEVSGWIYPQHFFLVKCFDTRSVCRCACLPFLSLSSFILSSCLSIIVFLSLIKCLILKILHFSNQMECCCLLSYSVFNEKIYWLLLVHAVVYFVLRWITNLFWISASVYSTQSSVNGSSEWYSLCLGESYKWCKIKPIY